MGRGLVWLQIGDVPCPATHRSALGGFDFMPAPSADYYRKLPGRIGSVLTPQQVSELRGWLGGMM